MMKTKTKITLASLFLLATVTLSSCGQTETTTTEGVGMGLRGYIRLYVEQENGSITNIEPIFHNDTKVFFNTAFSTLSSQIIEENSAEGIDVVAGATYTSRGIINAVADVIAPGTFPIYPPYPFVDATVQASP